MYDAGEYPLSPPKGMLPLRTVRGQRRDGGYPHPPNYGGQASEDRTLREWQLVPKECNPLGDNGVPPGSAKARNKTLPSF